MICAYTGCQQVRYTKRYDDATESCLYFRGVYYYSLGEKKPKQEGQTPAVSLPRDKARGVSGKVKAAQKLQLLLDFSHLP